MVLTERAIVKLQLNAVLLGEIECVVAWSEYEVRQSQDEARKTRQRDSACDPQRSVTMTPVVRENQRQHDLADLVAGHHDT